MGPAYGEIKQKHATLEGKPTEEESMVASGVMTLDVGQMTGLLLVSANRQTDRTMDTKRETDCGRGAHHGKTGPGMALAEASPSLTLSPDSPFLSEETSALSFTNTLEPTDMGNPFFVLSSASTVQQYANQSPRPVLVISKDKPF